MREQRSLTIPSPSIHSYSLVIFLILCLLVYTIEVIHERQFIFVFFSINVILQTFIVVDTLKRLPCSHSLIIFVNRTMSLFKEQSFQSKYPPSQSRLRLEVAMWHSFKQWQGKRGYWQWGRGFKRDGLSQRVALWPPLVPSLFFLSGTHTWYAGVRTERVRIRILGSIVKHPYQLWTAFL